MENEERFKFLPHTGDIKFQAYGRTEKEAYENAILAVSNYLARGEKINSRKGKVIEVSGEDKESLLYSLIEEIVYLVDAENFIVSKGEVTLRGNNLKAELYGDDADKYDHDQIKAATYAEMHIKKIKKENKEYWEIQAVVDV